VSNPAGPIALDIICLRSNTWAEQTKGWVTMTHMTIDAVIIGLGSTMPGAPTGATVIRLSSPPMWQIEVAPSRLRIAPRTGMVVKGLLENGRVVRLTFDGHNALSGA